MLYVIGIKKIMYLNIILDRVGEIYSIVVCGKLYLDFNRLLYEKCINKKFNKVVCLLKNSWKIVENVIFIELLFIFVYEVICFLIKKIF